MKPSPNLQLAIAAAKKAGEILRNGFGTMLHIEKKDEGKGIVTNIDKASEAAIIKILQKSPYPILAEEGGLVGTKSNIYWVVDPLDGTNNFSRQVEFFAISIALIKDNQVKLGVIYNPIKNLCYFAEKANGAFCNDHKIHVSKVDNLSSTTLFINYGYAHEAKLLSDKVTIRLNKLCKIRKFGTTALELCYVAQGSYEAFMSPGDELWDYAAGIIIVEEAGGKVSDWQGNPWNNSNSFVLASNGLIHEELIKQISDLQNP